MTDKEYIHFNGTSPKSNREDILSSDYETLSSLIKSNLSEYVDFKSIRGDNQVLLLGDTDHRQTQTFAGLAGEMKKIKESGIDYIAFEMPTNYSEAVHNFNETGDLSFIKEIAELTRTPTSIKKLFSAAFKEKISIHLIDKPVTENSLERSLYMGEQISKLSKEKGIGLVICGYEHLKEGQIPSKLEEENVSFKKIALFSAGQPESGLFGENFYGFKTAKIPLVFSHINKAENFSFVNVDKGFSVDGFLYFPRRGLIDDSFAETSPETRSITCIEKGLSLPSTTFDFTDRVVGNACAWKDTNWKKIVDLTSTIDSLTKRQKLNLSVMLENYVRKTLRHGGGSILKIEFDPEFQAFGIDTIDTFGQDFDKEADYGCLKRHREVSIESLIENFGIEKEIMALNDLPEPDFELRENSLEKSFKLDLLLAYISKRPGNIKIYKNTEQIYIYPTKESANKDLYHEFITSLNLSDFKLSSLESDLINLSNFISVKHRDLSYLFFNDEIKCKFLKRFIDARSNVNWKYSNARYNLRGDNEIEKAILESRLELRHLETETALKLLSKIENRFKSFEKLYDKKTLKKNNVTSGYCEKPLAQEILESFIEKDKQVLRELNDNIKKLKNKANKQLAVESVNKNVQNTDLKEKLAVLDSN